MPRYNTDIESLVREVEIHPFRGSGPGGQHRNKVESAIRLFHKPSGITVVASDHKLQGKNRELAFERLQGNKTLPRCQYEKGLTETTPVAEKSPSTKNWIGNRLADRIHVERGGDFSPPLFSFRQ